MVVEPETQIVKSGETGAREPLSTAALRYQLAINAEECSYLIEMQEEIVRKLGLPDMASLAGLPDMPDVSRFLLSPVPRFCLGQLQNFCWTVKRLRNRFRSTEAHREDLPSTVARPSASRATRSGKLYIDMTSVHRGTIGGGIRRVCLAIAEELRGSSVAQPVVTISGTLHELDPATGIGAPITLTQNDTYLIFDTFWDPFEDYLRNLYAARERGARTIVCVYDAIPVIYPGLLEKSWAGQFERQIKTMMPTIDQILTISDASAREIRSAFSRFSPSVPVTFFRLGADALALNTAPSKDAASTSRFRFVSVGTVEPKKGYDVAIDAFEHVWAEGLDVTYTICGRPGWICGALMRRIRHHAEYGRRLFWLSDASDADLSAELAASDCYIQASVAEGFGLPLVEASRAGLPLIASDLPVFREIAGDAPRYFASCDSRSLAAAVKASVQHPLRPSKIEATTWETSARDLLDVLRIANP